MDDTQSPTQDKAGDVLDRPKPDAVESLAQMYSQYFNVDNKEQVQAFDDNIDDLLTRLDEYHGLLDMIRSDSSLCLQRMLPIINQKGQDMQRLFDKIDRLAEFVSMVKQNLSLLEEQVDVAESELGSTSTVKKVLGSISLPSFLGGRKNTSPATSPVKSKPSYYPVPIFSTDDFIKAKKLHDEQKDSTDRVVDDDRAKPVNSSSDCEVSASSVNHSPSNTDSADTPSSLETSPSHTHSENPNDGTT